MTTVEALPAPSGIDTAPTLFLLSKRISAAGLAKSFRQSEMAARKEEVAAKAAMRPLKGGRLRGRLSILLSISIQRNLVLRISMSRTATARGE